MKQPLFAAIGIASLFSTTLNLSWISLWDLSPLFLDAHVHLGSKGNITLWEYILFPLYNSALICFILNTIGSALYSFFFKEYLVPSERFDNRDKQFICWFGSLYLGLIFIKISMDSTQVYIRCIRMFCKISLVI